MDREKILEEIKKVVNTILEEDVEIFEGLNFQKDLGLESVELFNLAVEIENHYDIFLQDAPFPPPSTVKELVDIVIFLTGEQ